ncbi:MAG: Ca2+-binding EF-hand superfamily protein [Paraglaciecola sp.]|jgi:Ca2+-binding EF-hand superfamily protein
MIITTLILASADVIANEDLMDTLDTNNDHRISAEEASGYPFILSSFTELDANNDGYLTASELDQYHKGSE